MRKAKAGRERQRQVEKGRGRVRKADADRERKRQAEAGRERKRQAEAGKLIGNVLSLYIPFIRQRQVEKRSRQRQER